jgi:hypothetical protein
MREYSLLAIVGLWAPSASRHSKGFREAGSHSVEVAGETTSIGSSKADQWASNHRARITLRVDRLDEALRTNPR